MGEKFDTGRETQKQ